MAKQVSGSANEAGGSALNLPNALTVLRLLMVPIFLWLLLMQTVATNWWALSVFIVAAYTDHLDGQIARSQNLVTNFGKLADPLADKFLTLGAFIALSALGELTWWFTIIIAVREIGITVLREVLRRKGLVVAASSGGKLKTVLQMGLIIWLVIPWNSFASGLALDAVMIVAWTTAVLALIVTVWSGAQYVLGAAKARAGRDTLDPAG